MLVALGPCLNNLTDLLETIDKGVCGSDDGASRSISILASIVVINCRELIFVLNRVLLSITIAVSGRYSQLRTPVA